MNVRNSVLIQQAYIVQYKTADQISAAICGLLQKVLKYFLKLQKILVEKNHKTMIFSRFLFRDPLNGKKKTFNFNPNRNLYSKMPEIEK